MSDRVVTIEPSYGALLRPHEAALDVYSHVMPLDEVGADKLQPLLKAA